MARCNPVATLSRGHVPTNIHCHRCSRPTAPCCSKKPRVNWVTTHFLRPQPTPRGAYTNPHGAQLGPCNYCGFCERYGCYMYAKASPQTTPEACRRCHPGRACRARRIRVETGDRPVVCRGLSLGDVVVRRIGTAQCAQCLAADRQPGSRTHLRVPLPRHWRSGAVAQMAQHNCKPWIGFVAMLDIAPTPGNGACILPINCCRAVKRRVIQGGLRHDDKVAGRAAKPVFESA